jgi:hypothetical protein
MKEFLAILATLIFAACPLCGAAEFDVEITEDPFSSDFPKYLKAPPDSVFDSCSYIIRINEYTHGRTPIVTEIRATETETRVTTIRLVGGKVDLSYSFAMKSESSIDQALPEWANALKETEDENGLDGTITRIEIFTRGGSKFISRWSREHNESARGLMKMNKWIEFYTSYTGIVARPYLASDANTEQSVGLKRAPR